VNVVIFSEFDYDEEQTKIKIIKRNAKKFSLMSFNLQTAEIYNDVAARRSYCDLYELRAKDRWFAHVVEQTSPHDDIELAEVRSFVTVGTSSIQLGHIKKLTRNRAI